MDLKNKYSQLLNYAQGPRVQNLSVQEQNNVLYVSGNATQTDKDRLWDMYNKIDPDMRAGDLVMKINTIPGSGDDNRKKDQTYEVKSGDSLSVIAAKYPNLSWKDIYEANKDIIKDPNVIHPGQKLKIPM